MFDADARRRAVATASRVGPKLLSYLLLAFILGPLVIIVSVSLTPEQFLNFPPSGVSLRWYADLLSTPRWIESMQISLLVALGATVFGTSLGLSLAYILDRYDYFWVPALGAVGILPILLPPITIGVAFFSFFILIGYTGSIWNLIVAHSVFFCPMPFILIYQGLNTIDDEYEEAAMNLGATPSYTFRTVTLPIIRTNVATGAIFVFILSLNEYVVAWVLSGSTLQTVPIRIFSSLRYSYSPIIAAVSVVFICVTFALVIALDYYTGGIWE